jgi:hypothetical protein
MTRRAEVVVSEGEREVLERWDLCVREKGYGVFDPISHEYRACVELRESDEPRRLGLEVGALAGGRYARVRLIGEPPAVYALIAPAMERLAQRGDRDPHRPSIEFYRRRDVIDLLQPVV